MSIFKVKRPNKNQAKQDALAAIIAGHILRLKTSAADYLNTLTVNWNKASKVIALIFFCLLFSGLNLLIFFKITKGQQAAIKTGYHQHK